MAGDVREADEEAEVEARALVLQRQLEMNRPWLSIYGTRVRPIPPVGSSSSRPVPDPSLLHRVVPDELLHDVFARMDPRTLGRAACVCRKWSYLARMPSLWRSACLHAWQAWSRRENERRCQALFSGSWRLMWRQRPRLRTEGVYVSRNTYLRCGIVEWTFRNPVHQVCYFRYLRFLPSGKVYYKTTPQVVREVAKQMSHRPAKADGVLVGRCTLADSLVEAALLYPGVRPTVLRLRLRLRGTCQGANNRLDLISLVTCGMGEAEVPGDTENVLDALEGWEDDESHHPDVPAVSHRRGMAPFVFVPWEEVDSDILNLPVDKMDFYQPG